MMSAEHPHFPPPHIGHIIHRSPNPPWCLQNTLTSLPLNGHIIHRSPNPTWWLQNTLTSLPLTMAILKLKHFIGQPWKAALPKYKHIINTHIDTKGNEMRWKHAEGTIDIRYDVRAIPVFLSCTRVYWYSRSNLKLCSLICSVGTYVYIYVLVHAYIHEHTPIHSQIHIHKLHIGTCTHMKAYTYIQCFRTFSRATYSSCTTVKQSIVRRSGI